MIILYNGRQTRKLSFDVYNTDTDSWEILPVSNYNPFFTDNYRHDLKIAALAQLIYILDLKEVPGPIAEDEEETDEVIKTVLCLWIYDRDTKVLKKHGCEIDAKKMNLHVICQCITTQLPLTFIQMLRIIHKY